MSDEEGSVVDRSNRTCARIVSARYLTLKAFAVHSVSFCL